MQVSLIYWDNTQISKKKNKPNKSGQAVIAQGEEGDVLYLAYSGDLDCEKVIKAGEAPTYLKTYKPGESFGELAWRINTKWSFPKWFFKNIFKLWIWFRAMWYQRNIFLSKII